MKTCFSTQKVPLCLCPWTNLLHGSSQQKRFNRHRDRQTHGDRRTDTQTDTQTDRLYIHNCPQKQFQETTPFCRQRSLSFLYHLSQNRCQNKLGMWKKKEKKKLSKPSGDFRPNCTLSANWSVKFLRRNVGPNRV